MRFVDNNPDGWQERLHVNADPYGMAILAYAQRWAELMEAEIDRRELVPAGDPSQWSSAEINAYHRGVQKVIEECAEKTSHEADTEGITGFMYGAAVAELCADWGWQYGALLKRWHNGEYGQPDAKGVVNPAILRIGSADD